jgi:hypothetical protein
MALESLKDIFEKAGGSGGGVTPSNPTPPEEQSLDVSKIEQLYKPDSKVASKITFGNPVTTDYSVSMEYKNFYGSGTSLTGPLATGAHSGLETYDSDNINKRKFDISTLGKDNRLGGPPDGDTGPWRLETLYNINHTANTNRIQIDTGVSDPNSPEGKNVFIDTGRAGMGSLGNLDIKGYSNRFRIGIGGQVAGENAVLRALGGPFLDGREPYHVNEIGSKVNSIGNNRDLFPFQASLEDSSRLLKFYTSTAGVAFMAKENIINFATSDLTDNPLGPTMAPPIPVPNTGFLNIIQQSVQGAGLGSIRRPFKIQYSTRGSLPLPFKNLGDRPNPLTERFLDINLDKGYPPNLPDRALKEIDNLKIRAVAEYMEANQVPLVERPTPFIDLSKGPKETDYFDKVSLQPVISTKSDDTVAPKEKGDFYVRIKDLRDNTYIYFRGYVTGITENVNPSWSPTNYIGRSEPVYMYERAERDLSFNLRVYPANHTEFTLMYEKIEKLTSLAYPEYLEQDSMTRMKPPFTELYMAHIGSRKRGKFGFIKSITYSVNETGDWDALSARPRLFDIAITYQILNRKPPSMTDKFYRTTV